MDTVAARPQGAADAAAAASRRRLAGDLIVLAVVGVLLLAALGAAAFTLYREFYSPTAFVERYLGFLADGRAGDALAVPGVAVDSSQLEDAGLPATSSDALLRSAALRSITDIHTVSEQQRDDLTTVTVEYTAGGYPGSSTFVVEPTGWVGVVPAWRFARSPLAVMDVVIDGSPGFSVNGFAVDKRQVSADGVDVDPDAALPLLVFSPGAYTVTVDTALAKADGVAVLADVPLKNVRVTVLAQPTKKFTEVVQQRVNDFLDACAEQQVLQPTGCPFGYVVQNRIEELPVWTIVTEPAVTLEPDGATWRIAPVQGTAHISVSIRSLFDGSLRRVDEDVPFGVTGTITPQPDGSVAITVSGLGD